MKDDIFETKMRENKKKGEKVLNLQKQVFRKHEEPRQQTYYKGCVRKVPRSLDVK